MGIHGNTRAYKGIHGYTRVYNGILGYAMGILRYTMVYNPMQICACAWSYRWTKKLWKIRAFGPAGRRAAGLWRAVGRGSRAAGLLLAKPEYHTLLIVKDRESTNENLWSIHELESAIHLSRKEQ